MVDGLEKSKILAQYLQFVQKNSRYPTRADMASMGFMREKIRHYFVSLEGLKEHAIRTNPSLFDSIIDERIFTDEVFNATSKKIKKHKRFFVTTAVAGCEVDTKFLKSIENFCKRNKALLLVLPCADPAAQVGWQLDSILKGIDIIFKDVALNKSIFISSIELSAKHVDPVTGLARIGQREGSFIYASPKQRLKMTPTSNTKLPHAIMTTGAITKPNYNTNRYMSKRTAYIANNDHVMGGIIVEIENDKIFHYRQVQANVDGQFADLGKMYTQTSIKSYAPDSLVLGDWHSGETDPDARKHFITAKNSVLNLVKPKRVVLHDGFNGKSISHHEIHNKVLRARHAANNHLSLQNELYEYRDDLDMLARLVDQVVVVKSNHDEFLDRYLREGRYVEDPQNHLLGLKLAAGMVEGRDPLKYAVEWLGLENFKKIVWLNRDEDFKVAGIELGAHGDKGANGARGNLKAMENAYGNSVSGHSHTPEILRGAWQVGTLSLLKLDYNSGPSSWMHTSCIVYPNGQRQLINVINGKWRLED